MAVIEKQQNTTDTTIANTALVLWNAPTCNANPNANIAAIQNRADKLKRIRRIDVRSRLQYPVGIKLSLCPSQHSPS